MAGVEAFLEGDGSWCFNLALIRHDGMRVSFSSGAYRVESLSLLNSELGAYRELSLLLNGRGVMHRTLSAAHGGLEQEVLLAKLFPGTSAADFYIQVCQSTGFQVFSLIRKKQVDDLLEALAAIGVTVVSLSLGPFCLLPFMDYLPKEGNELRLERHHFVLSEGKVADYQLLAQDSESPKRIKLGEEEMSSRYFAAFAAAALEVQGGLYPMINTEGIAFHRDECYQKRGFQRGGKLLLATFLGILLVNSFFMFRYNSAASALGASRAQVSAGTVAELRKDIAERESLFSELPVQAPGKRHWAEMADRLALSMPAAISLDEMDFSPMDEGLSRHNRRPVFQERRLRIKGRCSRLAPLNLWLSDIRGQQFCHRAELLNYAHGSKEDLAEFTLEIVLVN